MNRLASKYTSFLAVEERAPEEKWHDCYAPIYRPQPVTVQVPQSQSQSRFRSSSPSYGISVPAMRKKESAPLKKPSQSHMSAMGPPPPPSGGFVAQSPAFSLSRSSQNEALFLDQDLSSSMSSQMESKMMFKEKEKSKKSKKEVKEKMDYESEEEEEKEQEEFRGDGKMNQSNQHEQLGHLIAQQSSQGMFNFNQALAKAIRVDFSLLQNALNDATLQSISNNIREQVWATVLALEYLKKKLGDLVDEWEMAEKKARKWLVSQKVDLSPLSAKASQLIQ